MKRPENDGGKGMTQVITKIERPSQDLIDQFRTIGKVNVYRKGVMLFLRI